MRNLIEASKSDTLLTLDISRPTESHECEVVYSSNPITENHSSGRLVITHQQALQVSSAIRHILFATKP